MSATSLIGGAGVLAGGLGRVHVAAAPLAAVTWLAMPMLHDRSLYATSEPFVTVACGAALAATALVWLDRSAQPHKPVEDAAPIAGTSPALASD